MQTRFRHISVVLASVPSLGYALAYLALIPAFALAYTLFTQKRHPNPITL
jgi:hypothetical protein